MNQFDLPSYSSESRKRYKLRMLLMHLEAEESSKTKGKQTVYLDLLRVPGGRRKLCHYPSLFARSTNLKKLCFWCNQDIKFGGRGKIELTCHSKTAIPQNLAK